MSTIKKRGYALKWPQPAWFTHPIKFLRTAANRSQSALLRGHLGRDKVATLRIGGIRRRLLVWGLSLFGVALGLVVAASYFYTVRQIQEDAAELQSEIASVTAERIRNFVQRKIERFSDTARAASLYPLGSKEQHLLVSLLTKNDGSFTDASVIDEHGMELLKASDRRVYFASDLSDQSGSIKFQKAIKGENYISPVHTSEQFQPYVTLAIPLWGGGQSIAGVLAAEADLSFLWEVIAKIRFGSSGYGYLVDERGNLIAHKDGALVLKKLNLAQVDKVAEFLRHPQRTDVSPARQGLGLMDTPVLATYAPVPDLGWAVIIEEPLDASLANVEKLKRYAFVLLAFGIIGGAVVIAWVSSKMTGPIQVLRRDIATIAGGNLEHRTEITTGDEIEELATEFNKMTEALQNSYATLEHKVAQRTKEITALYSVTQAVNQSLNLNDILDAVIAKITDIFNFETTRVFLFDDQMEELQLRASFEVDPDHWTGVKTFKRGQGIIGQAVESGQPMVFEDIDSDPRYAQMSASKATHNARLRFFAVYPIKTQSRVFGAILFNARAPRKLTNDETRLLASMSEHIAVAFEKATLFRQSETRSQQLAVINMIGAAVSQSLNLDVLLRDAIEKMLEALHFDASWIYIQDPAEGKLRLRAYQGLDEETARLLDGRKVPVGISAKIFETGAPLVFEDIENDPEYRKLSPRNLVRSLGFATAAGFPIKAKDAVIGVLHLASRQKRHFAPDELQLIESIAQEIGVAGENARLFEQINQKTAELGQMNQELQEANRAKSEFIAAMSHELRTPLNVIMGNAELMAEGFFGNVNPDQKKSMTQIRHHSQFLLKLVNDVLALARLDAKKMTAEPSKVNLYETIAHIQSHIDQLNRHNRLQIQLEIDPDLPAIITDATKLEEILQNLIGNAFKFTPRGSITLRVRNLREAGRIEFTVADTGIGIEPRDMARIFSAFEQIKEAHTGEFNGVGLGLNIVKKYLELMDGEIRVQSEPGEGSTFIFSLPCAIPWEPSPSREEAMHAATEA